MTTFEDRDRWDGLITYLSEQDGALPQLRVKIAALTSYKISSVQHWTSGRAGLTYDHDPIYELGPLRVTIEEWAKGRGLLDADSYAAHQKRFLGRRAHNLPEYDYAFVGRQTELAAVQSALVEGAEAALLLQGAGGQGKTALAREYAAASSDYTTRIWLGAQLGSDLLEQLEAFAGAHGEAVPPSDERLRDRIATVCERIAGAFRGRVLLVVDDVPDLAGSVADQLAVLLALPGQLARRFALLLTSRHTLKVPGVSSMPVSAMTRGDALTLFFARSGLREDGSNATAVARIVGDVLGGHALAITLLATYAKRERLRDIGALEVLVRGRIVDAEALQAVSLQEYPASLHATFSLSFDRLSARAKLLLLWMSAFERELLPLATLKKCSAFMKPTSPDLAALVAELTQAGGPSRTAGELISAALVNQEELTVRKTQGLRLHEVIYDFALAEWARCLAGASSVSTDALHDLETWATRGAIAFLSEQLAEDAAEFTDVALLSGLLIPTALPARGLVPSAQRVDDALNFWYEHFVFQNLVYDTGIQETLLARITALRAYLEDASGLTPRRQLILDKLIGHGYYGHPSETGELAALAFEHALEVSEQLDAASGDDEGELATARWYRIFLLDHRANIASKRRDALQDLEIRQDPTFRPDFDEIEALLPPSLRQLTAPPSHEECELLLRAAHYWGHRGNQDSWIQYQRVLDGADSSQIDDISRQAAEHYERAANYRLVALRVFRKGQFNRWIEKAARKELAFVVNWLDDVPEVVPGRRFESFTTLAQGIGDTAHQYRGHAFVSAISGLAAVDIDAARAALSAAENALRCAGRLWSIAAERWVKKGEAPLRYRLSMNSLEAVISVLRNLTEQRPLPPLDGLREQVARANELMQAQMRTSYQFMADQQLDQVEKFWNAAASRQPPRHPSARISQK